MDWDTEGWGGGAVDVLVLYCGSQPDGARFVV